MSARNLLVELFVEELPPKALKNLGESFAQLIVESLLAQGLTANSPAASVKTPFSSPRRLAVHITDVADKAPDKSVQQKLMPVNVGFDAGGQPTPALLKRLSALGFDATAASKLKRAPDGKAEALFLDMTVRGASLVEGLQKALDEMLGKLPIPKVMSYQLEDGWSTVKFVRPAHGLVALHGDAVVPVSLLGLKAGRTTHGHRFEAVQASIELKDADSYAAQLEKEGAVIASFPERRREIVTQLENTASKVGLSWSTFENDALLDEVTALVERPNVLACQFESKFLEVPEECLILTMKANQKYFPLFDPYGTLSYKFLVVSNIRPSDASRITEGNERVVRPRLADAKFFFDQDRKKPLLSHLEGLSKVVYHNKLGSLFDRTNRIEELATEIAHQLALIEKQSDEWTRASVDRANQAARLSKCDLLTHMVGEFPELQGTMGFYYALAEKLDAEVADSIREQYLPKGAGDLLPGTRTGEVLSIADKLDTIAGMFAIDQRPSGTKDPFAVRRAALGILRIIVENALPIELSALIDKAIKLQPVTSKESTTREVYDYVMERLRSYYLEGNTTLTITTEMFDAVLANRPPSPLDFVHRLNALVGFLKLSDAQSLAAANKRITNILKKSGQDSFGQVDAGQLRDPAEQALHEQIVAMTKVTEPLFAANDYTQALSKLASLRKAVDAFFDGVMVMTDDVALRSNRLALLAQLRGLFLRVADLSRLPG